MLIISKHGNIYVADRIFDMTVNQWDEDNAPNNRLFEGFITAIDDTHPLAQRIIDNPRFEPVMKNNELVDIVELPPLEIEVTPLQQAAEFKRNLEITENPVLRRIEAILPDLYLLVGKPLPPEDIALIDQRADWYENIAVLEAKETP